MALRAPIPPGRYRLAVDLVEEHRFWLAELGNPPLEEDVDVMPRDASGARAFLPDGAEPGDDWHERARELHEEGYAAVGGAIEARRLARARAVRAGGGRHPRFPHPLVCPSLLAAARAELRGRRAARLPARARRAVDVRRPARAQTSIAIWSSTRVKTNAPSASATAARDDEVERVRPERQRAAEERRADRLDRRRERIRPSG